MVFVDTNILAYLLISGDKTKAAQDLYRRDSDWCSESFIFIELTNILVTCERNGLLDAKRVSMLLTEAENRIVRLVSVSHTATLEIARRFTTTAYDARFLVAAEQLQCQLVTEDKKLREAAPTLTQSLDAAFSN